MTEEQVEFYCVHADLDSSAVTSIDVEAEGEADEDDEYEPVVVSASSIIDSCVDMDWNTFKPADWEMLEESNSETIEAGLLLQ